MSKKDLIVGFVGGAGTALGLGVILLFPSGNKLLPEPRTAFSGQNYSSGWLGGKVGEDFMKAENMILWRIKRLDFKLGHSSGEVVAVPQEPVTYVWYEDSFFSTSKNLGWLDARFNKDGGPFDQLEDKIEANQRKAETYKRVILKALDRHPDVIDLLRSEGYERAVGASDQRPASEKPQKLERSDLRF